ncbi:unnamed protein product [Paramecium octaurelia]|uniref:UBC core domain-containing protein n=1 Tax=Paramecium octaurelia TaxID=43137 RepID=A0A8S1SGD5_PAROT|nr:unnamed protein product [Paramecium octaurelia]
MMDIRMQAQIQQANKDLQKKKQDQNKNKKFHLGVEISLERQIYFCKIFDKVQIDIEQNCLQYRVQHFITDCEVIYQIWEFEFEGKNNFEGRCIKGVLKFPPDYPKGAPSFYLDPVITDKGAEVLAHQCIYGDHQLCVHLFIFWDMQNNRIDEEPRIDEIQILQAVEYIFNNPDIAEGCPNPMFQSESPQRKQEIQQRQAEFLPFFNKDI